MREGGAVIMSQAGPLAVAHARAVDQHEELAPGVGNGAREGSSLELEHVTVSTELHGDRERVVRLGEVVPEHTVEHGEDGLALRAGHALAEQRRELLEREVDAAAYE